MTAMETRLAEKHRKECMRSYLDSHRAMHEAREMVRLQSSIATPQMQDRRILPPLNQNLGKKAGTTVVESLSLQDPKPEDEFCKLLEKFESAVHSFTTEFLESQLYDKIDTAPSSVPKTYNLKMKIKLMNHLLLKFDEKTRKLLQEEVLSTICHLVCHQRRMYRTDGQCSDIRTCKPCEARCTCNEDNLVHLTSLIKRLKRHYRHRLYEKKLTCGELENDDSKCSPKIDSPYKQANRPKSPRVVPYVHYRNVVNQIFQSNCCNGDSNIHTTQDLYESLDTEFPPFPYDRKTLSYHTVNGKHQKLVSCYTTDQSDSEAKNCKCESDFDVFNYPGWYGLHSPDERRLIACKINAQLKSFNTTPPFKLRPSEEAVSGYRKMLVDRVATFQSFEDSLLSYTMMSKGTPLLWCGNGPNGQPVFFPKDGRAGDCCSSCFFPGLPTPLSNLFQSWSRRLPDCSCCQEVPGNRWSRGRDGNGRGRRGDPGSGIKNVRRHGAGTGSRSTTGSDSSLRRKRKKGRNGKKKRKKQDNYTDTDDTFSSAGNRDKEKGKGNRRKKKKRSPGKSGSDSSTSIGRQRRKENKARNKKEQGKGKKHRKKSNSSSPKNLKAPGLGTTGSSSMMNASQNTSANTLKQKRSKKKSGKGNMSDKSGGSNRNKKNGKGKGRGNGDTDNDDGLKSTSDPLKGSHKKRRRGSDNEDPDEKRLSVLTNAELEKRLVQALKSGVPNPDQEAIKRILDRRKQSKLDALKTSSLSSLGSVPDKDNKSRGKSNSKKNGKTSKDGDSQSSSKKSNKDGSGGAKGGKNQKSNHNKSSQTSGESPNDNDNNSENGSRAGKGSVSSSTRGKGGDRMDSFTETEEENDPSKSRSPSGQDKTLQKGTNSEGKDRKNPNEKSEQGKSGKSGSSNKRNMMTDSKGKLKYPPGSKNMNSQTNYKMSSISPSINNSNVDRNRSRAPLDRLGKKPTATRSTMGIPGSKNAKSRFKDFNNTSTDEKAVVRNKSVIRASHFLPYSSEAPKFKNRILSRSTPDSSIKSSSFGGGSNSTRGYGSKNRNQGRTPNNTRRGMGTSLSSSNDEARRNRNNNRAGNSANEDGDEDETGTDEDRGKSPAEVQWKHATTSHLQRSDSRRSTSARKRVGNDKGSGRNDEKKSKVRFPHLKNKLLWGYVKPKPMKNESITWRGMYDSESSKRVGWENADDGKAGGGGGKMVRDVGDKHRIQHVYMSQNGLRKTTPQDPDWNGVVLLPSDDIPKSPVKIAFSRRYSAGSGVNAPRKEHRDSRHTQSWSEVGSRSRHFNSPVVDARAPGERSTLHSGGSSGGAGGDSRPDRHSGTRLRDQVRQGHVGRRDSSYMRPSGASRRISHAFPSESLSYDKYLLDNKKRKSYLDIEVDTPIDLNSPQENFFWVPLGKYSWEMRNIKVWKSKVLDTRENLGSKEYMQIFPEIKISNSFIPSNVDTTSHLTNVVPPIIPQTSSSCQNQNLICNHCLLDACCCCCLWS